MKGTRIVYVALVLCLAPCGAPGASAAQAQEPPRAAVTLALDEAIQQAVERHLELQAADARVVAAEGLRQQAALRPNPRLTFQVENLRGDRSAPFSYARDADTFFYGSQLIETGGKRGRREAFFLAETNTRTQQRDQRAAEVAARVGDAYWVAAGAARERAVLDVSRETFDRIVQYHRDRVNEGAMAEADLLRVLLEQDRLAIAVAAADQQAEQARRQLFREMGVPDPGPVRLTGDLEQRPQLPPLDEETAIARRADVRAARQTRAQAESFIALQRANGKPDPDVLFGYKRTAGFNTVMAGVQIDLPLHNRQQGAVAAAAAEARATEALARGAELRAREEIAGARVAHESRLRVIEDTLPRLRDRAAEIARIADAAYREGGTDLLRLLDAQRARLDADLLYYRTLTDYQRAVIDLKSALGALR